jgi:hypothetical protein
MSHADITDQVRSSAISSRCVRSSPVLPHCAATRFESSARPQIEKRRVFALNEAKSGSATNLFHGDRTLVCRSDADSQLIVALPFNQAVRISGVIFDAPEGGACRTAQGAPCEAGLRRRRAGAGERASSAPPSRSGAGRADSYVV